MHLLHIQPHTYAPLRNKAAYSAGNVALRDERDMFQKAVRTSGRGGCEEVGD